MLTFCRVFSCRIFSMREPRLPKAAWVPGRLDGLGARPALAYIKKHPAGSEPAGLYIINQGGFAGLSRTREILSALNKYEKRCGSREISFFVFFAYVFCISCFCNLLCVAVRGGSCCLCKGAVVSYGGNCTAPLHMRLFQPHIYNMINNLKNEKRFF